MCTNESGSDDAFQPEIIMDFIKLVICLCYLKEKIKIVVTRKQPQKGT